MFENMFEKALKQEKSSTMVYYREKMVDRDALCCPNQKSCRSYILCPQRSKAGILKDGTDNCMISSTFTLQYREKLGPMISTGCFQGSPIIVQKCFDVFCFGIFTRPLLCVQQPKYKLMLKLSSIRKFVFVSVSSQIIFVNSSLVGFLKQQGFL